MMVNRIDLSKLQITAEPLSSLMNEPTGGLDNVPPPWGGRLGPMIRDSGSRK